MPKWIKSTYRALYAFTSLRRLERHLDNHPVSKSLCGKGLTVNGIALGPNLVQLTPDFCVDAETFARLFMLPNNSTVRIQTQQQMSGDGAPPGIYVISNHPWIQTRHENSVGFYSGLTAHNGLFVEGAFVDHIFMDKAKTPPEFGTVAFAHLALAAYQLGWDEITLLAGGGAPVHAHKWGIPNMVGYMVWPKFGFDAPIEPGETAGHPGLSNCRTVSDVRAADLHWWEKVGGNGRVMRFDLTPWSKSWKTLLYYVLNK